MSAADTPARRPGIVLAVILVTQLMVILDATVVNIAMPKIQHALDFSPASLSWVQNAYALAFGGLLLLGARAGDLFGRRRVFITGVTVFSLASLLGGLAPNAELLLTARVLQGVGGAIAAPAALTLLMLTFAEGQERMKALGLYSLVSSGGASVGLVLGGMLTDWVSWRWGLFINVPIGIALVIAARQVLSETKPEPGRFDVAGALTSTLGITALVYGFIRVAEVGWGATEVLVAFAGGLALVVAFILIERRVSQPIVPLRLFRDPARAAAYLTMLLVVGTMFGMFFFLTQFLQGVLGFSPLAAGLAFLPLTGLLFASSRIVPRLVNRVDGGRLMIGGAVSILAGTLWLSQVGLHSSYLAGLVGPLLLFGVGAGMVFIPLTGRALAGVQPEDAGAASGLLNVLQQVGGALGLGILVTVAGTASRNSAATDTRDLDRWRPCGIHRLAGLRSAHPDRGRAQHPSLGSPQPWTRHRAGRAGSGRVSALKPEGPGTWYRAPGQTSGSRKVIDLLVWVNPSRSYSPSAPVGFSASTPSPARSYPA